MARGCARIDSRLDTAKIGSDGRVEVHRARLLAVFGGRKTFPHGLGQKLPNRAFRAMSGLPPVATGWRTWLEVQFFPSASEIDVIFHACCRRHMQNLGAYAGTAA